jgi:hypothetical protein
MEADNNLLLAEIRRIIKVDTVIHQIGQKPNQDLETAAGFSELRESFEKITKSLKGSVQSLTK